MNVNLYKLIEKKFKQNIEDETTLNLALDVLNQRENLIQENQKYKEVINKIKYICDKVPNDWTLCGINILHNIENILKEVENKWLKR